MIKILDLMKALKQEIKKCMPDSAHYFGKLAEDYRDPCFLYLLTFSKDTRQSFFVKDTSLSVQVVYFGKDDKYKGPDFQDKMQTVQALIPFLGQFILKVGERYLGFTYELTDADEQLSIDLTFSFKDDILVPDYEEELQREFAENVEVNIKEGE